MSQKATHILDVRTGRTIWQGYRAIPIARSTSLAKAEADVVIVGGGISGALVADALTEAGLQVLVLDRRGLAQGSTLASTALLQYEIDVPLSKLGRAIGQKRADRIWQRSRLAVTALQERVTRLGIACDMHTRSSLYLEGNVLSGGELQTELVYRRRAGFEVSYLNPKQVRAHYGISNRSALLGYGNLCCDPRKLALGFLKNAVALGAKVIAPMNVKKVETRRAGVRVHTDAGVLDCKHLIYATGYELAKGVPRKGHTLNSTWVIATVPQSPGKLWDGESLIWEASDPYLYLRVGPEGRVICGGEDESFVDEASRDALMQTKVSRLEAKLARLMPRLDVRVEYAWCGTFGGSVTGTPSIGGVPGMPNCYAVLGYGGNGITFSMLAAQLLTGLILGSGDSDADLFSFYRKF